MSGQNQYLLTSLETLGQPGTPPPLTPGQLLDRLDHMPGSRRLAETIFLGDDLLQWEALQAAEIQTAEPAVLTLPQVSGDQPLPEYLAREVGPESRVAADATWEAYFRHADDLARQQGCAFLQAWVGFEVGLKNALVGARAKALGLEAGPYLVATDLGMAEGSLAATVSEWASAPDPLAGQVVLDNARWTWLTQNDAWFSFRDDELAAYAAKLILLVRSYRIVRAGEEARQQEAREERAPALIQ